jgi:hypothetical protein
MTMDETSRGTMMTIGMTGKRECQPPRPRNLLRV